ncbi:MAG: hypothetical protein Q7U87_01290 [bacterium]|nr:hypothetical protein [bacterium]
MKGIRLIINLQDYETMGRGEGITAGRGRMIAAVQQAKTIIIRFVCSMAIRVNKEGSNQDQKHHGADGAHLQ